MRTNLFIAKNRLIEAAQLIQLEMDGNSSVAGRAANGVSFKQYKHLKHVLSLKLMAVGSSFHTTF